MMKENILKDKSYAFALLTIKTYKIIVHEHKEFVLSKQFLKLGTAIGALIREAEFAQSKADFISKLSISLKEANETEYWISLLFDSSYINIDISQKLKAEINTILKLLTSSINTLKSTK